MARERATTQDATDGSRHRPAAAKADAASQDNSPDNGQRRVPWRVEGERPSPDAKGDQPKQQAPMRWPSFWWILLGLLVLNWVLSAVFLRTSEPTDVPYSFFRAQVQAGNVTEVTAVDDAIDGTFKDPVRPPAEEGSSEEPKPLTEFSTHRPSFAEDDKLFDLLASKDVTVSAKPTPGPSLLERVLLGFGPTLLLVGLFILLMRRGVRGAGGLGGLSGLGRSRAKRYEPEAGPRTTFADVAGIDDVEAEVTEIVDFLKNPDRYRRLGASMPRGILLAGPPGTGKTLLARAVAGEADVPFYSVSASEFIEMIVGVGASRVRDLFEQAKNHAPSIIFIDELDAIGRARGGSMSIGGHDEREQTLNQILTEMDGFTGRENVVVLAATNRPDVLDSALLRPGRFDRRLVISPPDMKGRREILDVHVRSVAVDPDTDLDTVASITPGMVGADLKNLVNEAALLAARRGSDTVRLRDFTDALSKIQLGSERRIVVSDEERRRTAYHESGHALIGMLTPGADPVRKISIVPRGHALGVTFQSPDTDRYFYSEPYLRGRIAGMLGGRAAEQIVFGDVTTGAESDLEQATALARQMVGRWGMSEVVGAMSVLPDPRREQPFALDGGATSPATQELVEAEVRRILAECSQRAADILEAERTRLDALVDALLVAETLDTTAAHRAVNLSLDKGAGS
jgi:cell division protease FtsH